MSHPIPNHACSACGGQGHLTPSERANAQAPFPCPKCWDGGTPQEDRLRKIERRQRLLAIAMLHHHNVPCTPIDVRWADREKGLTPAKLGEMIRTEWEGEL